MRTEEAEAVAQKLEDYIIDWDHLEQALGIDTGSLSGRLKVPGRDLGQLTSGPLNAGDGSAGDAVYTSSTVGPNPGLAAGMGNPSHEPVQKAASPPSDLPPSERLLEAIAAGTIKTGTVVHLPTSPVAFLEDVPILHGRLIDEFSVRLAEYGVRLSRASGDQQDRKAAGQDGRRKVSKRKINQSLWLNVYKEFAGFRHHTEAQHPSGLVDLQEYLAWPRRQTPGDVSTSSGVMLSSLLTWILEELEPVLNDLHRSGSADAASRTEESRESDAGRHNIKVADELANLINVDLARQARGWFDKLEAIKAEAQKVKRWYTTYHTTDKLEPVPILVDRLDSLVRHVRVLSTFCGPTHQMARLLGFWTSGAGRKDLALFFERESGSSVRLSANDVESGWMSVLARISRAALLKWSGYLLALFQEAAYALANELSSLFTEVNEPSMWAQTGSTFNRLTDELRQELGCPLDAAKATDRSLSELKGLAKMKQDRLRDMSQYLKGYAGAAGGAKSG